MLVMPHARRLRFEQWQEQLRLTCPWLVAVRQDAPGIHNRNTLPWSRLFLIPRSGQVAGNAVTDVARRQRVDLRPGRIVLLPGNRSYAFDFQPGMTMTGAHLRLEWAPGCDAFANDDRLRWRDDADELADRAWAAVQNDTDLGAVARLRGLLYESCALFLTKDWAWAQARLAARQRLAPLLDRLEADPRADWSTATAARLLGVSREHCSRTFRNLVGVSLRAHRDRRLVDHACRHLLAGRRVGAVAEILGFATPFAFSRHFRRLTGMSPSAFAHAALPDSRPR